ncbi:MAG: class I SAM-dependent methyltransferase, partial [Anaerolineales bacterium]
MNTLHAKNRSSYDRIAPAFAVRNAFMPPTVLESAHHFITLVPSGGRILDAGCGAGRDSAWFASQGFQVTAFDLSTGMLREAGKIVSCSRTQGDMLCLPFLTHSFDALWCNAALLHVPKAQAPACLSGFQRVLKQGGVFYLALKAGTGELWEPESYDLAAPRFFARYSLVEGTQLVESAGFQV